MITVAADKAVAGDLVMDLDPLQAVNGKGQAGDPGLAVFFILQVEFGRRRVGQAGDAAHIIFDFPEQMGVFTHQVDITQLLFTGTGKVAGPYQAHRALAFQIHHGDSGQGVYRWVGFNGFTLTPAVAGLIEIVLGRAIPQIQDIRSPAAIDIAEFEIARIKLLTVPHQSGRIVHKYLRAKTAVTQIGPVTDLAVADAHNIGLAVAAHIGQINALLGIREEYLGPVQFIGGGGHGASKAIAVSPFRGMPAE